jgi:hypothetical protein
LGEGSVERVERLLRLCAGQAEVLVETFLNGEGNGCDHPEEGQPAEQYGQPVPVGGATKAVQKR